jgi:hypothetical protein
MSECESFSPEAQDSTRHVMLSGDSIIGEHEGVVAYDNVIEVNSDVDNVWGLMSRWGLVQDHAAGLSLPASTERWLRQKYRSLAPEQALCLRQLEAGNTVTDGPKGHKAIVREHTDEGVGQPKTLLFESHWPNGWHYTYQFYARGSDTDTTILLARTRWKGAKHPRLVEKCAPVADERFMQLLKSGLEERLSTRRDTDSEASLLEDRKVLVAGVIGGVLVSREIARRTPNRFFKFTAPLLGAAVGYAVTRHIVSNTKANL